MFSFDQVHSIHFELSSRCNARCPMCARTVHGGKANPNLYLADLSLEDVQKILPPRDLAQIKSFLLCGSYGDPMMAPDIFEITSYLLYEGSDQKKIWIDSNGAIRNSQWWYNYGKLLARSRGAVSFGVDGLEDTHSIYRRGVEFKKVMENAKAFIAGGGRARWNFIVFRHNEHQVEKARKLASQMGFESFRIKKTGRFFDSKTGQPLTKYPVKDATGKTEAYLEPPRQKKFLNSDLRKIEKSEGSKGEGLESYLNETRIQCESLRLNRIYINSRGLALPCGYLNHYLFDPSKTHGKFQSQVKELLDLEKLDATKHSLRSIISGPEFNKISQSWKVPQVKSGKLKACALFCGSKINLVPTQVSKKIAYGLDSKKQTKPNKARTDKKLPKSIHLTVDYRQGFESIIFLAKAVHVIKTKNVTVHLTVILKRGSEAPWSLDEEAVANESLKKALKLYRPCIEGDKRLRLKVEYV